MAESRGDHLIERVFEELCKGGGRRSSWQPPWDVAREGPNLTTAYPPIDELLRTWAPKRTVSVDGAFYHPGTDTITYPPGRLYPNLPGRSATQSYYHTILHELVHWTGHPTRLHRLKSGVYDESEYAAEEMVAEATAVVLSRRLQLTRRTHARHRIYFQLWWNRTDHRKAAVKYARREVERAVKYLTKEM